MDTRNKRSSAILVGMPWRCEFPDPDSTVGDGDRAHVAFYYAGFSSVAIVLPTSFKGKTGSEPRMGGRVGVRARFQGTVWSDG